jgi:hypothetical protein
MPSRVYARARWRKIAGVEINKYELNPLYLPENVEQVFVVWIGGIDGGYVYKIKMKGYVYTTPDSLFWKTPQAAQNNALKAMKRLLAIREERDAEIYKW